MANTTVSDQVAARVRELMGREMTVKELAARCADAGMPELTAQALYKLLGQRDTAARKPRPVTVDELMILAQVFGCTPVFLLGVTSNPQGVLAHPLDYDQLDQLGRALTIFKSAVDEGIVGKEGGVPDGTA